MDYFLEKNIIKQKDQQGGFFWERKRKKRAGREWERRGEQYYDE